MEACEGQTNYIIICVKYLYKEHSAEGFRFIEICYFKFSFFSKQCQIAVREKCGGLQERNKLRYSAKLKFYHNCRHLQNFKFNP